MSPKLWLPNAIPKRQTSIRGDQILSLEEQIDAWYGINQKLAWEYAGKHRKNSTWQCGYLDFGKPENVRLRPGAAVRPKGFYLAKIQLGQKYLGISVSKLRRSLKTDTGWGPEGLQFLFVTHFHFADLMDQRKIPFMTLADYDVTLRGFNDFFNVPQIFYSNKRLGLDSYQFSFA